METPKVNQQYDNRRQEGSHPAITPVYASQTQALSRKAVQNNLNIQEVSDYYRASFLSVHETYSYSDHNIPPVYHQFLAERQTWKHYFTDEFPGKDPLYGCFLSAIGHDDSIALSDQLELFGTLLPEDTNGVQNEKKTDVEPGVPALRRERGVKRDNQVDGTSDGRNVKRVKIENEENKYWHN